MLQLIVFSFLAGLVTILSPCILPILPIVLSGGATGGKKRPFGIIIGFILSFTFFTLALSSLVRTLGISADLLRSISVVIILGFGLSLLVPTFTKITESLFNRLSTILPNQNNQGSGFGGGVLLGLSLGLVWTPCVGPIIASVITLAATSSVNLGATLVTISYSIGTAIPMFAIMYSGRTFSQKYPWILAHTEALQKVFGTVMIIMAIAILFNLDRAFQTYVLTIFPNYGSNLTKFENNDFVQNQLNNLTTPTTHATLQIDL